MNRILSLTLLLLASFNLNAQHLNAGLRANATYRLRPVNGYGFELETAYGDHLNLTPEAFLRYSFKKKCVLEASFNRSTYRPPDIFGPYYNELGQRFDTVVSKYKADYNELNFSAFYELKCLHFSKSAFFKRMHNYVGLSAGIVLMKKEESDYFQGGWGCFGGWIPPGYIYYKWRETTYWTGIHHSMSFDLSEKVSLVCASYFKFQPGLALSNDHFWSPYTLAAQFGMQLGAAYRIF